MMRARRAVFGLAAAAALCAVFAEAGERPAIRFAGLVTTSTLADLATAETPRSPVRPLLLDNTPPPPAGERSVSPALAGLLSAVVPGSGQLALGARRGWVYLGVEAAAWFGALALRNAGDQAEDDFAVYADRHWDWTRYETVGTCGEGLGPTADFEAERARLLDLYENSRDDFYDDIGDLSIYACGWDLQANRGEFNGMRDDANGLYRAARGFVTAAFLNHIVSAVDAAKTAAGRRKAREHAFDLRVSPGRGAVPDVRFAVNRSF